MNLKLEACRNCQARCLFGRKVYPILTDFRQEVNSIEETDLKKRKALEKPVKIAARGRLSTVIQIAANTIGCPDPELERVQYVALKIIDHSLANSKRYGTKLSPSAPAIYPSGIRIPRPKLYP